MSVFVVPKYKKNYEYVLQALKNLKAVVLQTDTVIGLLSLNKNLLYEIKKRPLKKKSYYLLMVENR